MKRIIRDFYKAHVSTLIRYAFIVAVCIAAFFFTGIFSREKTFWAGIAVSAFLFVCLAWAVVDVLIAAPLVFKARLKSLPEGGAEEIISGYDTPARTGNRRLYKNYILFWAYRRIAVVRFEEISSADYSGRGYITLTLSDGKKQLLPLEERGGEDYAAVLALLKAKNESIAFFMNGSPVHLKGQERKDKKK